MKKIIFEHAASIEAYIAETLGKKVVYSPNVVAFSGINSPHFNFLAVKNLSELKQSITHFNLPLSAIAFDDVNRAELEELFLKNNISSHYNIEAMCNDDVANFKYEPNKDIIIKPVDSIEKLKDFAFVAGTAFDAKPNDVECFLHKSYNTSRLLMFVAYINDDPAGTGLIYLDENKEAGFYWDGVLEQYRNKRIGSELVKKRLSIAKEMQIKRIFSQNLVTSQNLYARLGFKPMGKTIIYVRD
jgi:predicted N-acetyltransferase YhbS